MVTETLPCPTHLQRAAPAPASVPATIAQVASQATLGSAGGASAHKIDTEEKLREQALKNMRASKPPR